MSKELCIGKLPERKRVALYVRTGAMIYPLAYFVSEEASEEFAEMVNALGPIEGEE